MGMSNLEAGTPLSGDHIVSSTLTVLITPHTKCCWVLDLFSRFDELFG